MANIQSLRRRIKTAGNIKQITKAMEMVAASKMRRAQEQALSSRPYARKLFSTLQTIANFTDPSQHPLLMSHESGKDIILLISTDKSLAGSLNTNLFRGAIELINQSNRENTEIIIIGQKARTFAVTSGLNLYAEFTNIPDPIRFVDAVPIADLILKKYTTHEFKSVTAVYMDFISTLVQKFRYQTLLPFTIAWEEFVGSPSDALEAVSPAQVTYVFEPNAKSILNWLLPYYIELTIYQMLLESRASEHSARMVAMKNASDNAGEIITDLTLAYNKTRQAKITSELLDNITSSLIVN